MVECSEGTVGPATGLTDEAVEVAFRPGSDDNASGVVKGPGQALVVVRVVRLLLFVDALVQAVERKQTGVRAGVVSADGGVVEEHHVLAIKHQLSNVVGGVDKHIVHVFRMDALEGRQDLLSELAPLGPLELGGAGRLTVDFNFEVVLHRAQEASGWNPL